MNSKEALQELKKVIPFKEELTDKVLECENIIYQDLDRLEQLEDNIKIHKETIKMQQNQIESLQSENQKLEKVIDDIYKLPNCYECDSNYRKGCMCLKKKINEVFGNE